MHIHTVMHDPHQGVNKAAQLSYWTQPTCRAASTPEPKPSPPPTSPCSLVSRFAAHTFPTSRSSCKAWAGIRQQRAVITTSWCPTCLPVPALLFAHKAQSDTSRGVKSATDSCWEPAGGFSWTWNPVGTPVLGAAHCCSRCRQTLVITELALFCQLHLSSGLPFPRGSVVKDPPANIRHTEMWVWPLGWEDPLE